MRPILLICCFTFLMLSACNQTGKSDPDEEIVQQLSQRRIIMLGDFAHGFPLPYQKLISTLNTWLRMIKDGTSDQRFITLFLEEDQQIVKLLNQYLQTGNLNSFLDFVLPSTSIEQLEFYSDLRRIVQQIDSLNSKRVGSDQIAIDIQGPEPMNILDLSIIDSSVISSRLFFVKERDSITAMNIVAYLNVHPKHKGILFFGNSHLIKNYIQKDYSGTLSPEESKGIFLGYYLKRALGETQVFTISQVARTRSKLDLDKFAGRDVLLLSPDVPWRDYSQGDNDLIPENFDAFIIRDGFIVQGHPLRYVFSRRIVRSAIARLEFSEPHRLGAMGNRLFKEAMNALTFLYDTTFSTADEWKSWSARFQIDGLKHFHSEEYQRKLFNRSSQVLGTHAFGRYIDELINLGFDPRVGSPEMTSQEWNNHLVTQWPQIVSLNAIGILWIGDQDEQEVAKEYLVEISKENFVEPDQYLKWWRKRFYGVTY